MVEPTMMATFWLLLRPGGEVGALEGVDEDLDGDGDVDAGIGAVVGGEGEDVEVEVGDVGVVVVGDEVGLDERMLDVVESVVEFAVAPDAAVPPLDFESVHKTGFCPLFRTMLKSLLMNVGGSALESWRSDTWKWHVQAFPSSRGTRDEPVAGIDWLYAGR